MLIDMAAKKYLPFSFFDDEVTQELCHYLNANAIVLKRDQLRRKTLKRFSETQKVVMELLQENGSNISFTVDAWTSVANKSYYGITGHFIDDQWDIQSLVIDFVPSNGCHSGKDIAKIFFETLNDHKLITKIQGITLDNASANTVFLSELAILMDANDLSLDPVNQHFRCFAHVINLAVNDMLRIVQANIHDVNEKDEEEDDEDDDNNEDVEGGDCTRVLSKLKTVFKKVKYSEQLTKKLESCCETTNSKMQTPNLGVATRWNSTCDMILSGIQMERALNLLCENNAALNPYRLSNVEWMVLKKLVEYLRHFKALSTAFSGDKYPTLPLVVIGINMMLDKLETFILSHQSTHTYDYINSTLNESIIAARDKLMKHYEKSNWMYCVVLILDPRHKVETFQKTHWGKEMANESIKQFEYVYRTKYYDQKTVIIDLPSTSGTTSDGITDPYDTKNIDDDVLDLGSLFASNSSQNIRGSGWRSELDNYLSLPRADKNENILTWWKMHEKRFPTLSSMAKDFLCIQATSVPVERFFSRASLVLRKHRNRLNNESARSLLCLNSWITCTLSDEIKKKLKQKVDE